jgi:DNA-binding transcriptional ArsR family regulator
MAARKGGAGKRTPEEDRLARLEAQMAAVLARLDALSATPVTPVTPVTLAQRALPQLPDAGADATAEGEFLFSGSIQLGAQPYRMLVRGNLSEAPEDEPEVVARVFAALGSPFRVRLLRALLEGPRTSQELQAELAVGPVGQLYHHLKELLAAGLIVQRKRSLYAIREEIVMPVCMAFAVAPRLASSQGTAPQAAPLAEGGKSPRTQKPARRSET